jgi:hypothetical protein
MTLETVPVGSGGDLCAVQAAARRLGRSIDLGEGAVFEAVIAVTELAHRLLVETPRRGEVELSVVRLKAGLGLEARVVTAGGSGAPTTAASLVIPPAPLMS